MKELFATIRMVVDEVVSPEGLVLAIVLLSFIPGVFTSAHRLEILKIAAAGGAGSMAKSHQKRRQENGASMHNLHTDQTIIETRPRTKEVR